MDLVLTEEEHAALPENRQNGTKQDDGTYRIALDSDPWVQIDAATSERDAMKNERDTFRNERDEARKQAREVGADNTVLKRSLKEFTMHGTAEDFASVKRRIADIPEPTDPKMAEMQAQLDTMKKERDEEVEAREAAEAARVADIRRNRLREMVIKAGVRRELIGMYINDLERRGLSEDGGRIYIGPTGNTRAAEDLIGSELGDSLKILVAGAAPAPGSREDVPPIANLDPDEVTLSGDPKERQAALKKLSEELYPSLADRIAGPQISST